jgi:hypothetical protein
VAIALALSLTFIAFVALNAARVVLTLYALTLGAPASSVGVLGGIFYLFPLLLSWPIGALADRIGARRLLLAGAIAALAATADPSDAEALPVVVMMRDRCFRVQETVPLQRISERLRLTQLYRDHPSYYAIYRYAPPPQPAGCLEASGPQPGD